MHDKTYGTLPHHCMYSNSLRAKDHMLCMIKRTVRCLITVCISKEDFVCKIAGSSLKVLELVAIYDLQERDNSHLMRREIVLNLKHMDKKHHTPQY